MADWFEVEAEARPPAFCHEIEHIGRPSVVEHIDHFLSDELRDHPEQQERQAREAQKLRKGSEPMRIPFMGTPDGLLRRLVADGHEVCGVFTQPDTKNRGHKVVPTPVKEFALTENIPVYQPLKMRDDGAGAGAVPGTGADGGGGLRPHPAGGHWEAPRYGLSTSTRRPGRPPSTGPSGNGHETTGVSIMYMAKELDAGDVILQKEDPMARTRGTPRPTGAWRTWGQRPSARGGGHRVHSRPDPPG